MTPLAAPTDRPKRRPDRPRRASVVELTPEEIAALRDWPPPAPLGSPEQLALPLEGRAAYARSSGRRRSR